LNIVRNRSSIPIPRVHAYSPSNENVIGLPYIIMDYVHGTTAFNLSVAAGNPMQIPTQYFDHYSTQIAKIMVELASIRFERIGSLTGGLSSDTIDDVRIGPIAETGEGHYDTAQDFYTRYPAALARTLYNDSMAPDSGGGEIVRRLPAFLDTARESSPEEVTYGLANFELGTNNVLVNASFDILAVIDLDSVIAAPRAVLHHFPWCIGADPGIPGVGPIQAFGDWNGRMDMCRRFAKIVERVADVEAEQGKERSFSAIEFFGKEALGFRALAFFRVKQSWVDQEWVPGLDWMHKCSDGELLKWYGMEDVTINNT
jgi:aminoglycoside phosphotransferase (APT) family kinase protein